jgi:predicted MPP superfamily phosphohydrolase
VNAENPDIILLGGDYVHRGDRYIIPCFNELKNLRAPLGIYGVLGNHDNRENAELTKKMMEESGIFQIDNKAFWIVKEGAKIKIGGVGDYIEDTQDLDPTLNGVGKGDFVILLSHNPDYAKTLDTDKIDLILSGHTHGGQITLAGLWAPIMNSTEQKFRTGLIQLKNANMIVSNGVGTITPPVRFFARPQIVTIILKKE